MQYFGIKNNIAQEVFPCEPSTFKPNVPADKSKDVASYRKWRMSKTTDHLIYTTAEALNSKRRVSKQNPVRLMHGLIADYDTNVNEASFNDILERCSKLKLRHLPSWITRTFSQGVRLIWEFEEPIPMEQKDLRKAFFKIASEELALEKLFPGLDSNAWDDASKLYDVGTEWRRLGDFTLNSSTLHNWIFQAAKNTDLQSLREVKIPIEEVAKEVERQYPGRWQGSFEVGARGVAFWDPGSDNPTSSIVTEDGMISFSQEQLFHSWAKLLGGSFVKGYLDDKIGNAVRGTYYDGNCYWQKKNNVWVSVSRDEFLVCLKSKRKLSSEVRGTSTEIDDARQYVHDHCRVNGVIPRPYDPRDVIEQDGLRFLNMSYIKAVEPVVEPQEWGVNFPLIARIIDARISKEQQPYLFAWTQRFYKSALGGDLQKGHVLFFVGGVNSGKTLLSNNIIGGLMGGCGDASSHVVKGTEFNKELLEKGLWVIDDGEVAADAAAHRRFSEVVKKLAANPLQKYRAMFRDGITTRWNGRLIVTLNDDQHSLGMIPDLEQSMEEKVMILKFEDLDPSFKFPPEHILLPQIAAELPYYGRFIADYQVPEHIQGNNRFGVREYINPDLRDKALYASEVGDIVELVETWIARSKPVEKFGKIWQGTQSAWFAEVISTGDEALRMMISKYNVRQLGRKFTAAARISNSRISIVQHARGQSNEYQIYLNGPNDDSAMSSQVVRTSFKSEPVEV